MTKISDIHDAIYSRVTSTLSDHKELWDPFVIENNDSLYLSKGFGVLIGPAIAGDRLVGCSTSIDRECIITNTLSILGPERNVSIRKTTEKNLFENQFKLIKAFDQDPDLNNLTNNFIFRSDSGIEFIFVTEERADYIMLQSLFSFSYFESLT